MSFINKVKNFFYEDVEDDEEYERNEMRKREEKERKRLEKLREKQRKNEEKERLELSRTERIEDTSKEDLSERELFKSEKTFNFPMNMGDDIFDDTTKMEPIEEKQETKEYKTSTNIYASKPSKINERYENISKYQKEEPNEPKKFKPTPVVSPVYGILDKNYTVEEVVEKNLSKTKEYSIDKKIVDFDSVRNRAYKELDEEIEKTLTGAKDIFYNLDDDEKSEETVEEYSEPVQEVDDNTTEVVITYDDEEETPNEEVQNEEPIVETKEEDSEEEEDEDFSTPDVEIPVVKKKRTRRTKIEEKDEKEDLFNLIDNMYKDDDEEEED